MIHLDCYNSVVLVVSKSTPYLKGIVRKYKNLKSKLNYILLSFLGGPVMVKWSVTEVWHWKISTCQEEAKERSQDD